MSNEPTPTEAWLSGPGATQFFTRTYVPTGAPPKAVVVALHGFAEHCGRFTHFHPRLAARGIAVFAYDQRGFGLTAQDTTGKKSKGSSYGKTSWREQMADIAWAVGHVSETFPGVSVFLLGHSMGGGEVLGFAVEGRDQHKDAFAHVSGVIATSPLIQQTTPAPKLLRWAGGKAAVLFPNKLMDAEVKPEQLSHDPKVGEEYLKDPLVKAMGSLRGLSDMLEAGDRLLATGVDNWPKDLPVLILHGGGDLVTSSKASQTFHDKISATSKKISIFPGGYHELQNEPDGVPEKLAEEIIAFIHEHTPASSTEPSALAAIDAVPADVVGQATAEGATGTDDVKAKM